MLPKATIADMIEAATLARYELEEAQERLLIVGTRTEPYMPYMRRAAILGATANFLMLIEAKKAAVAQVLRQK